MLQSPNNNVFVKVDHKYIKHLSKIMAVASIQQGASVDPATTVNIMGEIVSLPKMITNEREYEGFSLKDLRVGDKCIFSYLVIFNFIELGEHEEPKYRNRVWWDNEEVFACDITNLFAVIRDGEIIMVNGYVMVTDFEESRIYVPASAKRVKGTSKTQVMHIGSPKTHLEPIDVNPEDFVFFNPMTAQKYEINNKKFCIVQQDKILGREVVL